MHKLPFKTRQKACERRRKKNDGIQRTLSNQKFFMRNLHTKIYFYMENI